MQGKQDVILVLGSVVFALPAEQEEPLPAREHCVEPGMEVRVASQGTQSAMDELP